MKAKMFCEPSNPEAAESRLQEWLKGKKIKILNIAQSIDSGNPRMMPDVLITIFYEEK